MELESACKFPLEKNKEKSLHFDNDYNFCTTLLILTINEKRVIAKLIMLTISVEVLQIYPDQLVFPYEMRLFQKTKLSTIV